MLSVTPGSGEGGLGCHTRGGGDVLVIQVVLRKEKSFVNSAIVSDGAMQQVRLVSVKAERTPIT